MNLREFLRFHLMKTLLVFILIQIGIVALIQSCNNRPVAQRDETSVIEGKVVKINPLANDIVKDAKDRISVMNFWQPKHGSAKRKVNLLYYIPSKDFAGTDSFAYTISNGKKESKQSYIIIHVQKNLEPIAKNDEITIYSEGNSIISVLDNDYDREGDSLFIKEVTKPICGQVEVVNNQIVYKANHSTASLDSFKYTISDGKHDSKHASVKINLIAKNNPCYPWLSSDIGNVSLPGNYSCTPNSLHIEASGSDIWNASDGFRYVYQYVHGDCELFTRIDSFTGTNEWAKAGVMARESLLSNSKTAFVCRSMRNGATYHQRLKKSDTMEGGARDTEIKVPYWVKLSRVGDSCIYNVSSDGRKWKRMSAVNLPMAKDIYIGFAVCSHDNSEICKAIFSHYKLTAETANFDFNK